MKKIHWLIIAAALIVGAISGYMIKNAISGARKQMDNQTIQESFKEAASEPIPQATPFDDQMLK